MAEERLSPAAARVAGALRSSGVASTVRELPESTRTAADAALAVGCEVGAIANSLVFMADGSPLLVMTSGAHRVDTAVLAGRIGAARIERATPQQVREATGQAIGGVSPVGHPQPVRTIVDASLAGFPELWAAAGTPNAVFRTTFADLLRMTDGTAVVVTA